MALTYTTPNNRCGGGRFIYPNAVLDLIEAASEGSFVKLNTNRYEDIWPEIDHRATFGTPAAVIQAWSSIGWDSKRSRFYLFGGGHANSNDSGVYYWDAYTREWGLAFYSPDEQTTGGWREPVGGALTNPISAHTYSNNFYCPTIDRFGSFGGAAHSHGGAWVIPFPDTTTRGAYGYLMQLDAVGLGYVGGVTGSNFKRNGSTVNKIGARAWECLDYSLRHPGWGSYGTLQGSAIVTQEDGIDVVYQVSNSTTQLRIERITMPSPDPDTHSYSRVGRRWSGNMSGDHSAALDYATNCIVMHNRDAPFAFCDLKLASPENNFKYPTGMSGADYDELVTAVSDTRSGAASDPVRGGIFVYSWGGKVWKVTVPAGNPTPLEGWTVEKVADSGEPRPRTAGEMPAAENDVTQFAKYGVFGKFKYAPDLDAYIILQHRRDGDVWAWKPPQWQDPRDN